MVTRRLALATIASLAVPLPVSAQQVSVMKLMEPGPLPEKSFGPADAKVTIIEYASVTCHHCMNFHTETWPKLKEKYVDTGKIRFIMREFPLDNLATAGFMLARCVGEDRWYPMLDLLYRSQESWAHAKNPADELLNAVKQAGMTKDGFEACLSDQKLLDGINKTRTRGSELGVNSTPTFFVNGQKHMGALTVEQFDKILEPLLK